ncbi:MAG TPA: VOC family protein [Acidimicrobiia bacterium]|nr:VOC family protein [Acidimicrobiia bacterium]
MSLHVNSLTVDSRDPKTLAEWWAAVLDWKIVGVEPDGDVWVAPGTDPSEFPGAIPLLFLEARDEKVTKNRLHLDLVPDDQDTEVARLQGMGATRVDIGQGDVDWVVMADPEGNEFCVLRTYEG